MQVDLEAAIAQALRAARAFLAFAGRAAEDGALPVALAASMADGARQAVVLVQRALAGESRVRSPLVTSMLRHCMVDLDTLHELSELLQHYDMTPRNTLHLANAMRDTAEKAVKGLLGVQGMLGEE